MTRQAIIERTVKAIQQLPTEKAQEISDFADFVIKRYEEQTLTKGMQELVIESRAFEFLHNEEELYTMNDLIEVKNG